MKFLVRALLIIVGLGYFFNAGDSLQWYWFFIILFGSVFLSELLFIGKKRKPEKKQTKKIKSAKNKLKQHSIKVETPINPLKKQRKKKTDIEIIQTPLENLDGYEFERFVALYFDDLGYAPQIIGGAGDHEVDIVLTEPTEHYKIAVQCKHWKTKKVGNDIILRLSAGKRVHKCLDAWCITTNYYTKAAEEAAEANKVRLWNGLHVHTNIVKWQQEQLEKYKS